jgi:transcription antitermination factor NusA-like protein
MIARYQSIPTDDRTNLGNLFRALHFKANLRRLRTIHRTGERPELIGKTNREHHKRNFEKSAFSNHSGAHEMDDNASNEMRLTTDERKRIELQRKVLEKELAKRERSEKRRSNEPDYEEVFRAREREENKILLSNDSESEVSLADVQYRKRQLMELKVERELRPIAKAYGVSTTGTKEKLVDKIIEHEKKTMAMTEGFNEGSVIGDARGWRNQRTMNANDRDDENYSQTERSKILKDTYGFGNSTSTNKKKSNDDNNSAWARDDDDDEEDGYDDYTDERFKDERDDAIYEIERENPNLVLSKDVTKKSTEDDFERRYKMINGLREVAQMKVGLERDTTLILKAIASAIEEFYKKNARRSAYTTLDRAKRGLLFGRGIDVCADIDVENGNFRLLVRVLGRNGTIEREYDDAHFFDKWMRSGGRKRLTDLVQVLNEHMKREASYKVTEYYNEYMIGEVVTGIARVRGYDDEWLLDLPDGATARLPREEQIPGIASDFVQGAKVCVLVLSADENQFAAGEKAPILVSSAVAGLVAGVLTAQVPELRDGKCEIINIARIPGKCTKVLVKSNDRENVSVSDTFSGRINLARELICSTGEEIQIIDFGDGKLTNIVQAAISANVECISAKMVKSAIYLVDGGRVSIKRKQTTSHDIVDEFDDIDNDDEEGLLLTGPGDDFVDNRATEAEETISGDGYGSSIVTDEDDIYISNQKIREYARVEAIVAREDLPIAIGTSGTNVRLCASLCRCFIEIFTEDGERTSKDADQYSYSNTNYATNSRRNYNDNDNNDRRSSSRYNNNNNNNNKNKNRNNNNNNNDTNRNERWSEDLSWNRDNDDDYNETSSNYMDKSSFYDDLIGTLEDESWRAQPKGKPMNLTEDDISIEIEALTKQIAQNRREQAIEDASKESKDQEKFARMEKLEFDDEDDEYEEEYIQHDGDEQIDGDDDFYDSLWVAEDEEELDD